MTTALIPDWHMDALCNKEHVDLGVFFPSDEDKFGGPAKQICVRCPVRETCLREEVMSPIPGEGIRGGMTTRERRKLRISAGTLLFSEDRA